MGTTIYEYLVTNDWFGSLEKGTRLYYDYSRGGYVYHYEYESNTKDSRYNCFEVRSTDYFMSVEVAQQYILKGDLITGPALGDLEKE